ncbi:MAG: type II toxin-antitoxin system HicA family toxin [Clostridiales bacterium]|nr:type II toxin-antitoxin system HicA family toxin [Clostridiales bacterium]
MIQHLQNNGLKTISQNGSHVKLLNPQTGKSVVVPYHSKGLRKGLKKAILQQTGLK